MSMGSQGWNNYHPLRKYWQPLPCSLSSSISFSVHRYRFFPLRRTQAAHPTMPPPLPYLTGRLLTPIAPLGADSSSPPSARPPAASIPSDPTVERSPCVVNVARDKGYPVTNTLSGTRLATDLRDTAGSFSILTPELMADLQVNAIAEAVLFFSQLQRGLRIADRRWHAGGPQRSRQPRKAEGSRYQYDGGGAEFQPGRTVAVKF